MSPCEEQRSLAEKAFGRALAAAGLAPDEEAEALEVLALEQEALAGAARWLPDGPSPDEGLALEARLRGLWPPRPSAPRAHPRRRSGPRR